MTDKIKEIAELVRLLPVSLGIKAHLLKEIERILEEDAIRSIERLEKIATEVVREKKEVK